jgi:hypothetical protein
MSVPVSPYALRHQNGDVIKDRYTVRDVLGAGAFGTVYRVEESLGSRTLTLACKEMHVLSDPTTTRDERAEALQMFQEEAYVLQTLRHPNIPAAYFEPERGVWLACPVCGRTFKGLKNCPDHGAALQVVRDRFYLLMDFIEGPDLEEMLTQNKRPLDENRVLDYTLQVCDALRAVHAKGLSHRDIKPANIKIQKDTDHAMLIDFGLVKPSAVAGGYGTVLKKGSTGLGTLGYAPESHEEQTHPDARTDILALGMTLYRLLTDMDPSEPDQLIEMRAKQPNDFNLNLSDGLNAIIVRMIAHDPKNRYPDVAALQQDLRAARYPVEVKCPFCGHLHRAPVAPAPGTPCEQCGRPLPADATQTAANQAATAQAATAQAASARTGFASAHSANGNMPSLISTRAVAQMPGGTSAGTSSTRTVVAPRADPYAARLHELRHQIDDNAPPQTHSNDARIAQIEAQFNALSHLATPGNQCPGCRTRDLVPVSAEPNGNCPLCLSAKMQRRQWDETLCAVCHTGHLNAQSLKGDAMFCAICHQSVLTEEHRRKLGGLLDDVWGVCPHCAAAFDVVSGRNARLDSFDQDPFGVGALHKGRTLPLAEWRQLSGRSDNYSECSDCHAQFDHIDATQWKLAREGDRDEFGVWAKWNGKALSPDDWGKMANGLPYPSGNVFCPQCHAEWNYDQPAQTLELRRSETPLPDWAKTWAGARPIQNWYIAAGGKSSGRPGWLCSNCHTELDNEVGGLLKLVGTTSASLKPNIGQALTLRDWQRRGLKLPTESESRQLIGELQRSKMQVQADMAQWQQGHKRQSAQLQDEWSELLKRAIVGGFIPFRRMSSQAPAASDVYVSLRDDANRIPLRPSEELRWETAANLCISQVTWSGYNWSRAGSGTLVVTNERILFSSRGSDAPWQAALGQVRHAETTVVQGALLVVLSLYNTPQMIGFEIGDARFEVVYEGKYYTIALSPLHLATLIKNLRVDNS